MSWRTDTFRALSGRLVNIVGGKTADSLFKLGFSNVGDLLHHTPRRYISGTDMSDFSSLMVDDDVALIAKVHAAEHVYGSGKQRLRVTLTDGHRRFIAATFFAEKNYLIEYWKRILTPGVRGIFIGRVGEFKGHPQLSHPDFVILNEHNLVVAGKSGERERALIRSTQRDTLVGIYPAGKGVPTWIIADCVALVLEAVGQLAEVLPDWVLDKADVLELADAFTALHAPLSLDEAEAGRKRLRFGEALETQLALAYRRAERLAVQVAPIVPGALVEAFDAKLPFTLTGGQQAVSAEIFADLARPHPMSRLLQGEVGSGKTVLALRAMLAAVDSGGQAALLAPTEVLARQHHRTITSLMGELAMGLGGTEVALLTGSRTAATKRDVQDKLASGEIGIVVGTHALLSQGVEFNNLTLVVVDEQHRFGVEQRAALASKVEAEPHTLVMTATPIPRSVAMTVFGDLDVSSLREMPRGRADVKTVFVNTIEQPHWVARAWQRVREEVEAGRQAFVVCPRIDLDDPDGSDEWLEKTVSGRPLAAVTLLAEQLERGPLKGLRIAVVHGRQPAAERDAVMQRFAAGEIDVLVATTVIEVGIDVPNASMMVIVDADRFGLSQLHQLRGRIGRGEHPGLCLLLAPLTDPEGPAVERLSAMTRTRDGFELAETDLKLRREGNVLGAEQSGAASGLRLLRVLEDADMIQLAKGIADETAADDPAAEQPWVHDLLLNARTAGEWAART